MSPDTVRRRRWTRLDYERVVECGGFGPEDRIELLDGELWEMTPQGSRHAGVCGLVTEALRTAFGEGVWARVQSPIALDEVSEPEPDIAVVRGTPRDYMAAHPSQYLLLVEVSESTLSHDRGRKLAAYSRNGVPEFWLIDLVAERLEVYRDSSGSSYTSRVILGRGETVTPLNAPSSTIAVADLLP